MSNLTTYRKIAQSLSVTDIAQPVLGTFDKSTTVGEVLSQVKEVIDISNIIIVTENGRPFGFIHKIASLEIRKSGASNKYFCPRNRPDKNDRVRCHSS